MNDKNTQEVFIFPFHVIVISKAACRLASFSLQQPHTISGAQAAGARLVLPLISSQHHTSSVIWPINKLQSGVGVVHALPAAHCRPQDGETCFRVFTMTSISTTNNHFYQLL